MIRVGSIILACLIALAFAALCGIRWLRTIELQRGGGSVSPNGQFLASINGVYKEDFWGYKKEYYKFQIVPKKKNYPDGTNYEWELEPVCSISIMNPEDQKLLMYRGTSPFPSRWSPDSSRLEIDALGSTIILYTTRKAEQGAAANP